MNSLYYLVEIYRSHIGTTAKTILDIGSRDGNDANYLSQELFSKNVYTFEANSKCLSLINDNYPNFNNIYGAVSNYDGTAMFNRVDSPDWDAVGTSSLRDRTDTWYQGKSEKVSVPVKRMDTLILKHSIPAPMDLVKIDTEGCSFEVIEGFGENIADVKMIHVENETYGYWKDQKLSDDVSELLLSKKFLLVHSQKFGENSVDQVWVNDNLL